MLRRLKQLLGLAGVTLVACVAYVWHGAGRAERPAPSTLAPRPSPQSETPAKARVLADAPPPPEPAIAVTPAKSPRAPDDAALMTELRSLLSTNPERALALARDQ